MIAYRQLHRLMIVGKHSTYIKFRWHYLTIIKPAGGAMPKTCLNVRQARVADTWQGNDGSVGGRGIGSTERQLHRLCHLESDGQEAAQIRLLGIHCRPAIRSQIFSKCRASIWMRRLIFIAARQARAILLKRRAIFAFDGVMPATATVCPELTGAAGMAIFTCIYCVNKQGRASRGGQRRRYDLGSIKMR